MAGGRTYDAFSHRSFTNVAAVPRASSTATALALIAASAVTLPFAAKLTAATMFHVAGGTVAAASHTLAIVKSVAGTGTLTQVGTYTVAGTTATAETDTASVAETNFAAGDVIGISTPIATVAVTGTGSHTFAFEELPS
jgi:hypothetical protein